MRRALLLLSLLAPSVFAQGVEVSLREALHPSTSPTRRIQLMKQAVATPEGAALLAQQALDPARDEEVIHTAVAVLCEAGVLEAHVELVSLLLLTENDGLHDKIEERVKRYVVDPAKAVSLAEAIVPIARGTTARSSKDAAGRRAAVLVLEAIPHLDAVRLIVEVWKEDKDAAVRAECKRVLRGVMLAETPEQAEQVLAKLEPWKTFTDLQAQTIRKLLLEFENLRGFKLQSLKRADAPEAFAALENGDPEIKLIATARLRELAEKKEYGDGGAAKFAAQVLTVFRRERDAADRTAGTVANLLRTMEELAKGGENAPLWTAVKGAELAKALAPLAGDPEGWEEVGKACVSLLDIVGGAASTTLRAFASSSRSAEVRRQAIVGIGYLAVSSDKIRDWVGLTLSELLSSEKDPAVRQSILFQLKSVAHANAVKPIRAFLFPTESGKGLELSDTEITYCIEILRQIRSKAAVGVLERIAKEHADPNVRLRAVTEGLLALSPGPEEEKRILDLLREIVLTDRQPVTVRLGVVDALGEKGGRSAFETLDQLSNKSDGLEESIKKAVGESKLRLAERLVAKANGEAITPKDIEVAVRVLDELQETADPARLEKLARSILEKAAARKLSAGDARHLRAKIHARLPDAKPGEVLRLYREAVEAAAADRLPPPEETALRLEYAALLKKEKPDEARSRSALENYERLAALAGEDVRKAVGYLLDAAQCAVEHLENAAEAERLLAVVEKRGPLEEDLAARLKTLRDGAKALAAPG